MRLGALSVCPNPITAEGPREFSSPNKSATLHQTSVPSRGKKGKGKVRDSHRRGVRKKSKENKDMREIDFLLTNAEVHMKRNVVMLLHRTDNHELIGCYKQTQCGCLEGLELKMYPFQKFKLMKMCVALYLWP